jgi:hypothetical protein
MRVKLVGFLAIATAFGLLAASIPADAQDRARTRITVQKRSYLDAGTVVKPGSMHYHDYVFVGQRSTLPLYVPYADGDVQGSRWPLLRMFEGIGGY